MVDSFCTSLNLTLYFRWVAILSFTIEAVLVTMRFHKEKHLTYNSKFLYAISKLLSKVLRPSLKNPKSVIKIYDGNLYN